MPDLATQVSQAHPDPQDLPDQLCLWTASTDMTPQGIIQRQRGRKVIAELKVSQERQVWPLT